MLILLGQLVHILPTLIQLAEPQYFIVSDLDGAALALQLLFKGKVSLDQLIVFVTDFIGAFVSTTQFIGPLLVLDVAASCVLVASIRHLHAFITFTIVHHIAAISHICSQVLAQLEVLRGPTEHIM